MNEVEPGKILQGDTLKILKTFPDECIDCIVTSPPYYGLRDYGEETKTLWGGHKECPHEFDSFPVRKSPPKWDTKTGKPYPIQLGQPLRDRITQLCRKCGGWYGQLGLEPTLEMYLEHLLAVTAELKRVLKPTGTMWWNHGDSYASLGKVGGDFGEDGKLSKGLSGRGRIEKGSYPEKSLLLQNFRLVQRMVDEQKWILRNVIIWHKPNVMPSSVRDRFTVDFEPIFFFTKSKQYWFERQHEPYEGPLNRWGGDYFNLRVRDADKNKSAQYKAGEKEKTQYGKLLRDKRNMRPQVLGRNKRCVWKIPTAPYPEAHFATFPPTLVETPIKAGCPPGGIVLDPFAGSGTTCLMARQLGRRYIGIEINPVYIKLAERRLAQQVLL